MSISRNFQFQGFGGFNPFRGVQQSPASGRKASSDAGSAVSSRPLGQDTVSFSQGTAQAISPYQDVSGWGAAAASGPAWNQGGGGVGRGGDAGGGDGGGDAGIGASSAKASGNISRGQVDQPAAPFDGNITIVDPDGSEHAVNVYDDQALQAESDRESQVLQDQGYVQTANGGWVPGSQDPSSTDASS